MQFTNLGRTGLSVSRLCLGTAPFGKQTDEVEARSILDAAAEGGIDFVDTADAYPMGADFDLVGRTEEIVGRWLVGKRNRFVIATKGGAPMGPSSFDRGGSRKHLLDAIDGSLRRLGTDYVDLYQMHFDDRATPIDEMLEALDTIVRSGKARYVGVSNMLAYRVARAVGRSAALRVTQLTSVQPRYSLLFREAERELLPLCAEENLAVMPFNPLAGGLLSGKYRRDAEPAEGRFTSDVGAAFGKMYQSRYWHEREFDAIDRIKDVALEVGLTLATLSVAWILANASVTSAVIGASRVEQLVDTLASCDVSLDTDVKARLDQITSDFRRGDAAV